MTSTKALGLPTRRLAGPAEGAVTLEQYAAVTAEMAERDPAAVLAELKLTLPAWTRIDRRWSAAMAADREVAARIKRLVAEARERLARTPDPDHAAEEVEP